jgi:prephenate dehydrogenase
MQRKKIAIVGVGLIGGSLAIQLKEKKLSSKLIGVDLNKAHTKKAVELELVDETMELDDAIRAADVLILPFPSTICCNCCQPSWTRSTTVVMDMGKHNY